ncbi:hypothetical protein [Alteribacillus sp. HJP-4]|uniref:hypothetical protein n=1 Tax=Alteribacillus sp. HJP-4 TaxID=2775394 RepID=UPI0035CD0B75
MRQPMFKLFLLMIVFVLLFFLSVTHLQGMPAVVLEILGFAGMMFVIFYGLLVSKEKESSGGYQERE